MATQIVSEAAGSSQDSSRPQALTAEPPGPELTKSLRTLAEILGPTTVVAALMYYFGWVRTHSFYQYFGIDADVLSLSTVDYVLRSAIPLWPFLLAVAAVALAGLVAHTVVDRRIEMVSWRRPGRILFISILALGVVGLVVAAAPVLFAGSEASPFSAIVTTVSLVLLAYSNHLYGRLFATGALHERRARQLRGRIGAAFVVLIVLSGFWATALFADAVGRGRAQHLEQSEFVTVPDVIIYSKYRLHVDAADITETDLGARFAPYRFRYEGLKLLVRGDKRLLLIPYSWSTSNPYTLVVPEGDAIMLAFRPNF